MLGLGETTEELLETLADLRFDRLRLAHARPVPSAVRPAPAGRSLRAAGRIRRAGPAGTGLGFADVASGPFVRSSYHADEMAIRSRHPIAGGDVPLTDDVAVVDDVGAAVQGDVGQTWVGMARRGVPIGNFSAC